MKKLFFPLLFISALFLSLNCTGSKKQTNPTTNEAQQAKELAKKVEATDATILLGIWNITSVNGVKVVQTEETPYLNFNVTERKVSGMTGCNRLMGDIILDKTKAFALSFDKMASTRMMCPQDSLESAILTTLAKVASFEPIPCVNKNDKKKCIAFYDANKVELMTLQQEPLTETELQETPQNN